MSSTKGEGFTLIELMVVVAILGIIAAIGTISYNGYISGTKKKAAENMMQQIGLAETEEYSSYGVYAYTSEATSIADCAPDNSTINTNLFGAEVINDDGRYGFCVGKFIPTSDTASTDSVFTVVAKELEISGAVKSSGCIMTLTSTGAFTDC